MRLKICVVVLLLVLAVNTTFSQVVNEKQLIELVKSEPGIVEKMWDEHTGFISNTCLLTHWMDFDNDNDFDLVILGKDRNSDELVKIFLNKNGQYEFVQSMKATSFDIPEVRMMAGLSCTSNIIWYDHNDDGYTDFMLFQPKSMYQAGYNNNGDGTYTRMTEFVLAN